MICLIPYRVAHFVAIYITITGDPFAIASQLCRSGNSPAERKHAAVPGTYLSEFQLGFQEDKDDNIPG